MRVPDGLGGYEYMAVESLDIIGIEPEPKPKYCNKCGKELVERSMSCGYDVFTGKPLEKVFKTCPTLQSNHFYWDTSEEYYG